MKRSPADDVLIRAVRLAMAISIRAADDISNVSPVQLRALTVLWGTSGANLVQLAESMGITVSTASRLVDRLIAAGLADRRPSPQTRREVSLSLIRAGRAMLDRYDRQRLAGAWRCLDQLPPADQEAVIAALQMLVGSAPTAARREG